MMYARFLRWCAVAAMVLLGACGGEAEDAADLPGDTTQPAPGTQVPQANPQTEVRADTPVGPVSGPAPGSAAGRTYAECEAEARGKSAEERAVLLRACAGLPGAPR